MIVGDLKEWKSLKELEGLAPAFQLLEKGTLAELPPGRHSVEGEKIYAIVVKALSRSVESAEFESHRRYIDVQYLVSGIEMIGVAAVDKLKVSRPYQEEEDYMLYSIPQEYTRLEMYPGRFAVFLPEDGHMPNCHLQGPHELHKVVVKVAVDLYRSAHPPG